jgi:hypothetical protein
MAILISFTKLRSPGKIKDGASGIGLGDRMQGTDGALTTTSNDFQRSNLPKKNFAQP